MSRSILPVCQMAATVALGQSPRISDPLQAPAADGPSYPRAETIGLERVQRLFQRSPTLADGPDVFVRLQLEVVRRYRGRFGGTNVEPLGNFS